MLFEVKERLEGLKYHIDFGGRRWGYVGDGERYAHFVKRGHFTEACRHFFSSLSERKIVLLHTC